MEYRRRRAAGGRHPDQRIIDQECGKAEAGGI